MENKKEKLEDFKTAISSTVRSLSNSQEIEISFGNQAIKSSKNSIRLPDLQQQIQLVLVIPQDYIMEHNK